MAEMLGKSQENHEAQYPKLNVFVGQKLMLYHNYIQNVEDRFQIRV